MATGKVSSDKVGTFGPDPFGIFDRRDAPRDRNAFRQGRKLRSSREKRGPSSLRSSGQISSSEMRRGPFRQGRNLRPLPVVARDTNPWWDL